MAQRKRNQWWRLNRESRSGNRRTQPNPPAALPSPPTEAPRHEMVAGELFGDWLPGDNDGDKELLLGLMRLTSNLESLGDDDR